MLVQTVYTSALSYSLGIFAVALLLAGTCFAEPDCLGIATKDIHSDVTVKKGEIVHELHLQDIDDDGHPLNYAVHGGGLYPADSIKLTNCHIVKMRSDTGLGFSYESVLDNTVANSKEILRSSVERSLLEAGLDDADAGNAALAYIESPETACGKAARMVLSGQSEMVSVIVSQHTCQPR